MFDLIIVHLFFERFIAASHPHPEADPLSLSPSLSLPPNGQSHQLVHASLSLFLCLFFQQEDSGFTGIQGPP